MHFLRLYFMSIPYTSSNKATTFLKNHSQIMNNKITIYYSIGLALVLFAVGYLYVAKQTVTQGIEAMSAGIIAYFIVLVASIFFLNAIVIQTRPKIDNQLFQKYKTFNILRVIVLTILFVFFVPLLLLVSISFLF